MSQVITSTQKGSITPLKVHQNVGLESYEHIQALLVSSLSQEHADFFATPVPVPVHDAIEWTTGLAGAVQPLVNVPDQEQQKALSVARRIAADIEALVQQTQASPSSNARARGKVLALCLQCPGPESLFVVGNRPVLVNWACSGPNGCSTHVLHLQMGMPTVAPSAASAASVASSEPATPVVPVASPTTGQAKSLGALAGKVLLAFLGMLVASLMLILLGVRLSTKNEEEYRMVEQLWGALAQEQRKGQALAATLAQQKQSLESALHACLATRPTAATPLPVPSVPVPPPPPPPEAAPALSGENTTPKGEALRVPENAWEDKDFSFLQGCWEDEGSEATSMDARQYRLAGEHDSELCFDSKGNGRVRMILAEDGTDCIGFAVAKFTGSRAFSIKHHRAVCVNKSKKFHFREQTMQCSPNTQGVVICNAKSKAGVRWQTQLKRK